MALKHIQPGASLEEIMWNSRAVIHNGYIFLSGVVADNKSANMNGQTADVLEKIDGILASAGSEKAMIASAVVYISDMALKDEMNQVWM